MAKSHTQDPLHTTIPALSLDQYILEHSDDEPEYLYQLWRATNIHMLHGRMASGRLQGRILKMFVEMVRPQNIIEVGTFSGYSALCLAEGLASIKSEGKVYTFEINDEQEPFTRKWIEESPWANYVEFIIGDATKLISSLPLSRGKGQGAFAVGQNAEAFDMAFLDGDKRTYVETYEALLPLMNPGAIILADNTLWDGHVVDPEYERDHQTQGIRRFNDYVKQDSRVTRVMLPLRDGLTIVRVKE